MRKVCCIIGSRISAEVERHPIYISYRFECLEALQKMIQDGVYTFYTTLEMGPDVWCANIVLGLKRQHPNVQLICVVDEIEFKIQAICDKADMVMFVSGNLKERHQYIAMRSDYLFDVCEDNEYINSIVEFIENNNQNITVVKLI